MARSGGPPFSASRAAAGALPPPPPLPTSTPPPNPRSASHAGLNGSGKSNVLDAICFVLGITNLSQVRSRGNGFPAVAAADVGCTVLPCLPSTLFFVLLCQIFPPLFLAAVQVRAASLSDLVYKQGQGGVTKATVSIVFDNRDAKGSPPGYEHCETVTITRTIVIGGRNKYLINGHAVQANAVQDLFHAVQLNVNNPHFLIMQVRARRRETRGPQRADQLACRRQCLCSLFFFFFFPRLAACWAPPLFAVLSPSPPPPPPRARSPRRAASPRCST